MTAAPLQTLLQDRHTWLVTGASGFIGSHLAKALLVYNQNVIGLDDFSSSKSKTLPEHENFTFIEGSITDAAICARAVNNADYVLHHAAIASVVQSFDEPDHVKNVNEHGFENILNAAQNANVKRVVFASSSAVYGNPQNNTKRFESDNARPLSPYAETKLNNEILATSADIETVGLRYFNIYGTGQNPNGAYAAVIPKWFSLITENKPITIFGDGETVRDFCHISDVIIANITAARSANTKINNAVLNIGAGTETSLNTLFTEIKSAFPAYTHDPVYKDFRQGDVRYSCADITLAQEVLGFTPQTDLKTGIAALAKSSKAVSHAA